MNWFAVVMFAVAAPVAATAAGLWLRTSPRFHRRDVAFDEVTAGLGEGAGSGSRLGVAARMGRWLRPDADAGFLGPDTRQALGSIHWFHRLARAALVAAFVPDLIAIRPGPLRSGWVFAALMLALPGMLMFLALRRREQAERVLGTAIPWLGQRAYAARVAYVLVVGLAGVIYLNTPYFWCHTAVRATAKSCTTDSGNSVTFCRWQWRADGVQYTAEHPSPGEHPGSVQVLRIDPAHPGISWYTGDLDTAWSFVLLPFGHVLAHAIASRRKRG